MAWELAKNENHFDEKQSNEKGFDFEKTCSTKKGTQHSNKVGRIRGNIQCCGDYPFRYSYNNKGKECCGYEVLKKKKQQCCVGEIQENAGECEK